jgi:glycosyltransferase involved in cell wall biosynthesis
MERANQRALAGVIDRFQPDVVSVWHMGALSISLLTAVQDRGLPMVFGIADDWPTYALALDPWAGRWTRATAIGRLAARVLRTPTVVGDVGAMGRFCFISECNQERCVEGSPWAFPQTAVVHAGVELSRFPGPESAPAPWGWQVLYVGRLDPRKGTHTLLRAMAELDAPARLTFCTQTQGTERTEHEALADSLGLAGRVSFTSAEHDEVAAVYRSHDCVVFCSEWPEPFGLVPLEAMASGTPVVATGVGGSGEFLVDGENCLLYPPGDATGLAHALTTLASDDALRATLRRGGLATAQTFNQQATTDAYDHWHREAVAGAHT